MTQHKQRALTGATIVLSLAMIAAPLAFAKGSHHSTGEPGESPGPESGEGSAKDFAADAKPKKAVIEASRDMIQTNEINAILARLSAAEMKARSPLAIDRIENQEARLQAALKKI
jgi:hypothetical protein